jgi:hypothetical protein
MEISKAKRTNNGRVDVLLAPVGVLPFRVGWAILSTASLFGSILLLRRWETAPSYIKTALIMSSPPMFYLLLHRQIDVIILCGLFFAG